MKTAMKTMATALVLLAAAGAAAEEAPQKKMNYRCENAKTKAEAAEFACMYRCERKADRKPESERESYFADCANRCHERCDRKKQIIEDGPACRAEVPTPDPERCAAKHLAALSQLNLCLSYCPDIPAQVQEGGAVPRSVVCRSNCDENYAARRIKIDALEVCMSGGTPVCLYQ